MASALTLALLAVLVGGTPGVAVVEHGGRGAVAPVVETLVPVRDDAVRERLAAPPAGPIAVDIVPDLAMAALVRPDWRLPAWAAGAARPEDGRILITLHGRHGMTDVPRVLTHELAHLAIHDAAGGRPLPRWLDEGIARVLAGEHDAADTRVLARARIAGAPLSLDGLAVSFPADPEGAARAYAIAGRAVALLVDDFGADVLARLLARVRDGASVDDALFDETGLRTFALSGRAQRSVSLFAAWSTVLVELDVPMLLAALLAVVAFLRLRRLRRARLAAMDDDEDRPAIVRWRVRPFARGAIGAMMRG